ncbi:MAG: NAD(P)/FAD-dependent oxidoreductase [Candidatus Omnitrophica bacterium]|nr:NAD(P)/FAD-dependent oxidoreductase [Candidatus Omnitrophota bacterium]MDD5653210.1 NAD(P)/FAD-dependent oxidoreductase [Candidatus Omnitrophota bacterium]
MSRNGKKTALIIGAGPAGLTAAYELLTKTDIKPIVYEINGSAGGIARTIEFKNNKIDIGGHRFFSKSEKVTQWWLGFLPLQGAPAKDDIILNRNVELSADKNAPDPEKTDKVMLMRNRISRILFLHKFFEYPLGAHFNTFINLGAVRTFKIGISYLKSCLFPIKKEKNLEDFFINRFGRQLYLTFFKKYTQKVWGVSCKSIPPEWGYQRVKGLSILKLLSVLIHDIFFKNRPRPDADQEETSLIKQFMYPKLGAGQLWEEVAQGVRKNGGDIFLHHKVIGLKAEGSSIIEAEIKDEITGNTIVMQADYFFSTMPVKDLIRCLNNYVPKNVADIAEELPYRDFITVGLLLKKMKIQNDSSIKTINNIIPDNWIYIQERYVKIGRLQIFNNWSPYMVADSNTAWLGLEYFCKEGDYFWNKPDSEIIDFGIKELIKLDFIENDSVLDGVVIRSAKAYPAYFGAYGQFDIIKNFTDNFENLFLIGRNGMHRYNNMDHSMLTAMAAVENITLGTKSKENIWAINTEEKYNESS